jgi:hypothetical protein
VAAVTPVSSAPDALAAETDARRQGSRVQIADDRTPFWQTFADPDGTATYRAAALQRDVLNGTLPDAGLPHLPWRS